MGRETRPRKILRGMAAGYSMDVSPAKNLGYLLGTYEPHLTRVIRKFVRPGQTVYDIGAYLGYVTLLLARTVGPQGRVVSFEAIPETAEILKHNVALNRIDNVQVLNYAACDITGEVVFRIPESSGMASMAWHRHDTGVREVVVAAVQLDQQVSSGALPAPQFVKIDVEGAEALVLAGMKATIQSARPVIFLECSDKGRELSWELLRGLGYSCASAVSRMPIHSFEKYRHDDFVWQPAGIALPL